MRFGIWYAEGMERLEKVSHFHNIGTFWLTAAFILWSVVFARPAQPQSEPQSQRQTEQVAREGWPVTHWAIPAVLTLAIVISGALQLMAARERKRASTTPPPVPPSAAAEPLQEKQLSPAEVQVYWNTKNEFERLRWSQKVALQVVFGHSGIGTNKLAENLAKNMDFCGSQDNAFAQIVEPLLNTDLVRFVGPEIRINPSNCTLVEKLLDEFRKVIA